MRNFAMWTLGALMCSLAAFNADEHLVDFEPEKMEGKWYLMGSATNAKWFVKNTRDTVGFVVVEHEDGNVRLTFTNMDDDDHCKNMTFQAKKDGTHSLSFFSEVWQNHNHMHLMAVEYDNFALIHTNKTKDDNVEFVSNLYSRTLEVNQTLQEKFVMDAKTHGVDPENIIFLAHNSTGCH